MKICKNGQLVATLTFNATIDRETDVVTLSGIPPRGVAWSVELEPREIGVLHAKLDQRVAKIRAAYEALTKEQQARFGSLMAGAAGSTDGAGLGVQEKLIARVKAETE
jgi:hypothetical protein